MNPLKLNISRESSIKNIQEQFNVCYPFLKIEFLNYSSSKSQLFKDVHNTFHSEQVFEDDILFLDWHSVDISKDRTVAQLEQDLEKKYGFLVQVYRRIGKLWIGINLTNDWTLEHQNKEGELISSMLRVA